MAELSRRGFLAGLLALPVAAKLATLAEPEIILPYKRKLWTGFGNSRLDMAKMNALIKEIYAPSLPFVYENNRNIFMKRIQESRL